MPVPPLGMDAADAHTWRSGLPWRPLSTWTLRAKLVASMLALFAVITIVSGALTVVYLDRYLTGQVDEQLRSSITRFGRPVGDSPQPQSRRGPGDEGLQAFISTGDSVSSRGTASDRASGLVALTPAELSTLQDAALDGTPHNIQLGSRLGSYRVMAQPAQAVTADGSTVAGLVVVGLPRSPQEATIGNMIRVATGSILIGLIGVGLGGAWLVRRNLAPLHRVAGTATRVANLPLDTGSVALAERVPDEDTDTRTEVGQVGHALNEMLDHIDAALNARHQSEQRVRQFVADASHELRTPLASIRGYAELTRKEPQPIPETVVHALGRVESEATRMTSLVDDLLLLARLDAGRPLDREPVDLTEMMVNAVSDAHAASPAHAWQLDLPDEPVEVPGDPARLHQIVANLLANARTHTAAGTTVRTMLSREGDTVRISVCDNGPGVPQELQANVFQRFARGDTSRNRTAGSTGLGLSIVAAVAHAHGGTVELSSHPGDTRFSVLLPA